MNYQEYLEQTQSIDKVLSRRCYAAFIDYFIFLVVFHSYANIWGMVLPNGIPKIQGSIHYLAVFIIWVFIFPFMEMKFGFTLGKSLFHLKVVYNRNNRFISSLLRHCSDLIDLFLFFGIVAIVMVKYTAQHKRIGDYLGNTTVEFE